MSEEAVKQKNSIPGSAVVAKAGIWYTICNFLFRGMAFITTPVFTRLMSKSELGAFSNYSSWVSILLVVVSFDLAQSVIRSKLEHGNDMDCYIWSILSFSTISTLIWYGIVLLFPDFFCSLFRVEMKYIHLMFAYFLAAPAYQMLITKHRAFYKYKLFVLVTGIAIVTSTALSVFFVMTWEDKFAGRALGYFLPYIVMGAVIYASIVLKSRRIRIEYWKYACVICLPLVPHVLSLYLLSSSDKLIVTRLCGEEYTAIYSVAYSAYHITTILFDSMNKAWAPWLLDSLQQENYDQIRKTSKIYIAVFALIAIGILMLVPEIILVLGGRSYIGAVFCLPPLVTSCVFQFIYTMYVNIEFYKKKTVGVAVATMIATAANIILNFIFIPMNPEYGYVIAAYTTLAGYVILFILHYIMVRRMKLDFVYDIRYIVAILVMILLISGIMNRLYSADVIRWILIVLYGCGILYLMIRNRKKIIGVLRKRH